MFLHHRLGLSTYLSKFRLVVFAMTRSRAALRQSSTRFAASGPFQMQILRPFLVTAGSCCPLIRSGPECANSSLSVLGSGGKTYACLVEQSGTVSRLATRYSIRLNCLSNCSEQNRTSLTERSNAPNCFSFAFNTNSSRAYCTRSKASVKRAPRVSKLSRNDCRSGAVALTRFSEK
jgi:hypothetical protein